MKIYLVRHGETTGDIEDRIGGSYDDHLTEKGRQQLAETALKLAVKNIEVIFTSPLIRARESADIINEKIGCEIHVVDGLKERHYGIITGMIKVEAAEKYPEAMARHNDITYTHPEGESYNDCYQRVTNSFKDIISMSYTNIVILGHGGSLKCILKSLGRPLPDKIEDGEIFELDGQLREEDCPNTGKKLVFYA